MYNIVYHTGCAIFKLARHNNKRAQHLFSTSQEDLLKHPFRTIILMSVSILKPDYNKLIFMQRKSIWIPIFSMTILKIEEKKAKALNIGNSVKTECLSMVSNIRSIYEKYRLIIKYYANQLAKNMEMYSETY